MSDNESSRDRILESAVHLFAQHGLERTTLADIAKRASLSKATLYHHFPDGKASIFHAAVDGVVESLWEEVNEAARKTTEPAEQLLDYVRLRIETFDRQMSAWGLDRQIWGDLKPWAEITLERYIEREHRLLADLIERGMAASIVRKCDAKVGATVIQAILRGLTEGGPIEAEPEVRSREIAEVVRFVQMGFFTDGYRRSAG